MIPLIIADKYALPVGAMEALSRAGYFVVEKTGGREVRVEYGTDLRDQFAMAALTALIRTPFHTSNDFETVAPAAYKYADAMLKEREKWKPPSTS